MSAPASSPAARDAEAARVKKAAKAQWGRLLKEALDADTWGQSIEATELYEKLYRLFEQQIPELPLNAEEKGVEASINDAQNGARQQNAQQLTLDEVKALQPVLADLFVRTNSSENFPIQLKNYTAAAKPSPGAAGEQQVFIAHEDQLEKEERGSLLQPPKVKPGSSTISIVIDKIGLKDAQTYIGGFLTVSVAAPSGELLESQDTPKSNNLKPTYVVFGNTVHIQTTLEDIVSKDLCLFFEFKHFKPAKKKMSTRCFALLESKELDKALGQQVCLELYKKPTDFSRKSLSLFTIKPLYLHCTVQVTKH